MNKTEKFLREINKAFSENNFQFLLQHVTEDFCWIVIGRKTVSGKAEFTEALQQISELPPMNIDVRNIIVSGKDAVVEGIVIGRNRNQQKKTFGFCDVYKLTGVKDNKIQRITSYVIDVSQYKQYKEGS